MINVDRELNNFRQLTEIDSLSFDERHTANWMINYLKKLGFEVSEDNAGEYLGGNAGNIFGTLKGAISGEPILFSSHLDTVSPGINKKMNIHTDGTITSDGTTVLGADDVSGIVEILEGIESLEEDGIPHRDIEVLFTIGEEAYGKGSAEFDYSQIKARTAYVLDLSGKVGVAANRAPSIVSFEATINGVASHAGFNPESGVNAIAIMCEAITRIKQGHIDDETTLNIGKIVGGTSTNIVPDQATFSGEIRSYSHEKALKCIAGLSEILEETVDKTGATFSIDNTVNLKAYCTALESETVVKFKKSCEKLGLSGEITDTFGGSDNNNLATKGISGIVLSCGMYNVHSVSEYTTIKDLEMGARLVADLILE